MTTYLVRRLLGTIPVLLLITLLVFLLLHAAPGDPASLLLSDATSEADVVGARQRWGLDQPVHIQYFKFFTAAVSGDLGKSFRFAQPVSELIAARLPATIELATFFHFDSGNPGRSSRCLVGGQAELVGGQPGNELWAFRRL